MTLLFNLSGLVDDIGVYFEGGEWLAIPSFG